MFRPLIKTTAESCRRPRRKEMTVYAEIAVLFMAHAIEVNVIAQKGNLEVGEQ